MKRILCYGDSNTYGYISGSNHKRFSDSERWTSLLSQKLCGGGYKDYFVIEEGLNSRTILSNDPRPGKEGRSGYDYLLPCLDSHDPLDLVIVMLGTNEVKVRYEKTAKEIAEMFEKYIVNTIKTRKYYNSATPQILIITPVKVNGELARINFEGKYDESSEIKSIECEKYYKEIARRNNCHYLSALDLETGIDGVHLTKDSHAKLAERVYEKVKAILN